MMYINLEVNYQCNSIVIEKSLKWNLVEDAS